MNAEMAVQLARRTLEAALWTSAPILGTATVVALIVSILQVMTAIQENMIASVLRLVTVGGMIFFLMPWLLRRMIAFTIMLFGDFHPYLR